MSSNSGLEISDVNLASTSMQVNAVPVSLRQKVQA